MKNATLANLTAWKQAAKDGAAPDGFLRKWFSVGIDIKAIDEERRLVPFTISTDSPDRDGDTIAVDGWRLDNYKRNPVVLWAHDSWSLPVAKAVEVAAFNGALRAVDQFATKDQYPFADTVFELIKGGYLNATSVGFLPMKFSFNEERAEPGAWFLPIDFEEQELLEHSVVPVPANPEALIDAKAKGIDTYPVLGWAIRALDEWAPSKSGLTLPKEALEKVALLLDTKTTSSGPDLKAAEEAAQPDAAPPATDKGKEAGDPPAPSAEPTTDVAPPAEEPAADPAENPDPATEADPPATPVESEEDYIELEEDEDDGVIEITRDELVALVKQATQDALNAAAGKLPQ